MELLGALDTIRRWLGGAPSAVESDPWVDAAACQVPQRSVRDAVRRGELTASRAGGKLLVRRSELDRWIEARRVRPSKAEPSAELVRLGARRVA